MFCCLYIDKHSVFFLAKKDEDHICAIIGSAGRFRLSPKLSYYPLSEPDRRALRCGAYLHSGRLAIDVLGGSGNLRHRARLHGDTVCRVHALLDDDAAGRNAFTAAKQEGVIDTDSINFTSVGGKSEAELEDLYKEETFRDILKLETGLD
jgi:hypothetical protein